MRTLAITHEGELAFSRPVTTVADVEAAFVDYNAERRARPFTVWRRHVGLTDGAHPLIDTPSCG